MAGKKIERKTKTRMLAEKIAAMLFRSSFTHRQVQRLVLTDDEPHSVHGGWGEKPAADRIEEVLIRSAKPKPKRKRK